MLAGMRGSCGGTHLGAVALLGRTCGVVSGSPRGSSHTRLRAHWRRRLICTAGRRHAWHGVREGGAALILVVMGVSGSGKSTLGRALAAELSCDFVDGDDYHPRRNVAKMRSGRPLTDEDRLPWLERLNRLLKDRSASGEGVVVACSALKSKGREILSQGVPELRFIFLHGESDVIRERMQDRTEHFMPSDLLDSQIESLEPPGDAVPVPVDLSTAEQVDLVLEALRG